MCNKTRKKKKNNTKVLLYIFYSDPDSSSFIYIYIPLNNFSKGAEKIFLCSKLMQ